METVRLCCLGLDAFAIAYREGAALTTEQTTDTQTATIEARVAHALDEADQLLHEAVRAARDKVNVTLPTGSVNGLAAAIAAAGPNGRVTVERGVHYESGTVRIHFPVTILGMSGAEMHWSGLEPAAPEALDLDPAIYVHDTGNVTIKGLTIRPAIGCLRACLLFENVLNAKILGNKIHGFQAGIVGVGIDRAKISGNTIVGPGYGQGIGIASGDSMLLADNKVSAFSFGLFLSGSNSAIIRNKTREAFIGILLCRLDLDTSANAAVEALAPTNDFLFARNESAENAWGILAIDGAFDNVQFMHNVYENSLYGDALCFETEPDGTPELGSTSNTAVILNGNSNRIVIQEFATVSASANRMPEVTGIDPNVS